MLSLKRNSLGMLCLLLVCCQEYDPTVEPTDSGQSTSATTEQTVTVLGTGRGTETYPYTVEDIQSMSNSESEAVWVIGYMVGTARFAMKNAVFSTDATNQSNILLSSDPLCTDTERCIPVELASEKWKKSLSLPANVAHFRKCLLVKGIPSQYLNKKGLQNISAGLWLDDFDMSSIAPQNWSIDIIS